MKAEVVSLLPSLQEAFVLPISTVLDSAGLEVLIHKEATLPPGVTSRGIELVAVTATRVL